MMRFLIAFFLFTTLWSSTSQSPDGAFIGLSGGQNQTFCIDFGFSVAQAGYSAWGFHFSADSSTPKHLATGNGNYESNKALWNTYQEYETKSQGFSLGGFLNLGRVVMMAGASKVNSSFESRKVWQDGTTELHENFQKSTFSPYGKLGYTFSHTTIYGGWSGHYGVTAGVGFTF